MMMRKVLLSIVVVLVAAVSTVNGFSASLSGGSTFVISQRPAATARVSRVSKNTITMGKQAKFGIFSPAVYGAKIVLGQKKLNQIRGKGISLHSQAIGEFCTWAGAYHLRTRLIKKAKTNGDILGFLV
mmetsp:Transcript_9194/g.13375  ORF Transcript_9194/g.13375 Transcript_9194/m.13375 type:complete len:128 (+) Transcript_9194:42-425(+)